MPEGFKLPSEGHKIHGEGSPPEVSLKHPGANECNVLSLITDFLMYKLSGSLHSEVTLEPFPELSQ